MAEILYATRLTKLQLKQMVPLLFTVNRSVLRLGAVEYQPGSVMFKGFVGRLHTDTGLYHGNYTWRDAQPSDCERNCEDHNTLPELDVVISHAVDSQAGASIPTSEE